MEPRFKYAYIVLRKLPDLRTAPTSVLAECGGAKY
jgi:hypothetical protein